MDEANQKQEEGEKGGQKKRIGIVVVVLFILVLIGVNIYLLTSRREVVVETEEETRRSVVLDEENVDEMLDMMATMEQVEPGYYTVTMNYEWHFPDGESASTNAYVENLPENTNDVYFDLVRKNDESVVLYQSPVIPRGRHLDNIKLDEPLGIGTYDCVAIYHLVDEEQQTISTVRVTVVVVVDG